MCVTVHTYLFVQMAVGCMGSAPTLHSFRVCCRQPTQQCTAAANMRLTAVVHVHRRVLVRVRVRARARVRVCVRMRP